MQTLLTLLFASLLAFDAAAADLENGQDINELCAGCHGEYGSGGKNGEYPRLAGQPAGFIAKQIHLFRDRKRPNMPMLEYIDERQMPDADIEDISAYLAGIKLLPQLPAINKDEKFDPLARLLLAKKVLNIRRVDGDVAAGHKRYNLECRCCHGANGEGRQDKEVPMLAGQYTNYLWRQVDKYRKHIRIHDDTAPEGSELLDDFSYSELQDIFAYLATVDDTTSP